MRIILIVLIFLIFTSFKVPHRCEVYEYIVECQIKHPKIVYKQAILESNSFKSRVFKVHHNMFGFRKYGSVHYMHFKSWEDCVEYYSEWQNRKYKGGNYYQFLIDVRYAEDPKYIQKIKSIKTDF